MQILFALLLTVAFTGGFAEADSFLVWFVLPAWSRGARSWENPPVHDDDGDGVDKAEMT